MNGGRKMKCKLIVLLCLIMVFTAACAKTSKESDADSQGPPALVTVSRDREYGAALGSYSWTAGREQKEVDMPWPPVIPEIAVPVEQGQRVGFGIHNITISPERAEIRLFGEDVLYNKEAAYGKELEIISLESEAFTENQGIINFEYTFPHINPQSGHGKYILELKLVWAADGSKENNAVYYALLQHTEGAVLEAVERAVSGFFEGSWKGLKQDAAGYLTEDALKSAEDGGLEQISSFASVNGSSGWRYLLWQDSTKSFSRTEEPLLTVTSIGPETNGPYAEAQVKYVVEVTDGLGKQTWHFDERYNLQLVGEEWKIFSMERNGKPYDPKTGKAGWEVSVERKGRLLQIGPFTSASHYTGVLSPGGDYAAFIGNNFGVNELWRGSINKGEFDRAFYMDTAENQRRQGLGNLVLLKAYDDGRVLFMAHGYISTGEYKGQQGFWIMEQAKNVPMPKTLAFIADAKAEYYNSLRVTGDDRYVLIQKTGQLCRIDLTDGTHEILRDDMPGYLTIVYYNEDATLMGWERQTGHEIEIVLYDPLNKKETLLKSPKEGMRIDLLDISGDSAAVSLCKPELVQQGEDGDWPVGIERILVYGLEGQIKTEITPAEGLYVGCALMDAGQDALYYTTGDIRTGSDIWMGAVPLVYLHSTGLYKQSIVSGESSKVSGMDGHVYYSPGQPGQRVLWYTPDMDEQGNGGQKGLVIGSDGSIDEIIRRYTNNNAEWSQSVGSGDREYICRLDRNENRGSLIEIQSGRKETILEGQISIYDLKTINNTVIFTTEPSDGSRPAREYLYILSD
jgi:hypothetical protein